MDEKKPLKKWHLILLIAIGVAFVGIKIWQTRWPEMNIQLGDKKLHVLLADTYYHQYKGLGGRESLAGVDGMLFIYSLSERQGIVMRDMKFPIDVVWLNQGRVVDYAQNLPLQPGVAEKDLTIYYPRTDSDLVLELPAGWVEKNGLKMGEAIQILN